MVEQPISVNSVFGTGNGNLDYPDWMVEPGGFTERKVLVTRIEVSLRMVDDISHPVMVM